MICEICPLEISHPGPFRSSSCIYVVESRLGNSWFLPEFNATLARASFVCPSFSFLCSDFHPLPGPFLARCSTRWQNYHYWGGTWHKDILRVHQKHGSVVRISHYEVLSSTPTHSNMSSIPQEGILIVYHPSSTGCAGVCHDFRPRIRTQDPKLLDPDWLQFNRIAESKQVLDMEHWTQYLHTTLFSSWRLGGHLAW